jgi:ABC-type multidrug transport system fused ATPase/permease subunit
MALLVVTIILILAICLSPKICEKASWATEHLANNIANEMDDVFNNLITVYSFNKEEYEKQRLDVIHNEYHDTSKKTIQCTFNIKVLLFPVMVIFISYFMYRCYTLVKSNKIDSGKFVSLFLMTFYITNSMWGLIGLIREVIPRWGRLKENINIFSREGLSEDDTMTNNKHESDLIEHSKVTSNGLVLQNVYYKYHGSEKWILNDVNLVVQPNSRVAFVGRIGSGKTTILKLLMGYKTPQSGQIYYKGIPYSQYNVSDLRREIGYIHQYPILFNRTIYENIVYGLTQDQISVYTKEKVWNLFKLYGIQEILGNQPNGLDTHVGRKGHKLSGGQRQIVWLMRVMLMNPSLLILDEPTASIDDHTRNILFKMLDIIMQNRTVIIVTHDKDLMRKASTLYNIENGNITTFQNTSTWDLSYNMISNPMHV